MSDSVIRISLAEGLERDRTDWALVATLDDAAIDLAIAGDPDTFALSDTDRAIGFEIHAGVGGWYWVLRDSQRRIVARGPDGLATKEAAQASVEEFRRFVAEQRYAA